MLHRNTQPPHSVGDIPVSIPVYICIELDNNTQASIHMHTLGNNLVVTHRDFKDAKEKWAEHTFILFVIAVSGRVPEA